MYPADYPGNPSSSILSLDAHIIQPCVIFTQRRVCSSDVSRRTIGLCVTGLLVCCEITNNGLAGENNNASFSSPLHNC